MFFWQIAADFIVWICAGVVAGLRYGPKGPFADTPGKGPLGGCLLLLASMFVMLTGMLLLVTIHGITKTGMTLPGWALIAAMGSAFVWFQARAISEILRSPPKR